MAEQSIQLQEEIREELQDVQDMNPIEFQKTEESGNTVGLADAVDEEEKKEDEDEVAGLGDDEEDDDEDDEDEEEESGAVTE